jgi:hypothetical protein
MAVIAKKPKATPPGARFLPFPPSRRDRLFRPAPALPGEVRPAAAGGGPAHRVLAPFRCQVERRASPIAEAGEGAGRNGPPAGRVGPGHGTGAGRPLAEIAATGLRRLDSVAGGGARRDGPHLAHALRPRIRSTGLSVASGLPPRPPQPSGPPFHRVQCHRPIGVLLGPHEGHAGQESTQRVAASTVSFEHHRHVLRLSEPVVRRPWRAPLGGCRTSGNPSPPAPGRRRRAA